MSADLGGNIRFDDDVPSVTAGTVADGSITLTTQDAQTIGAATDSDSASFAAAFLAAAVPVYGADGAGSTVIGSYTLTVNNASSGLLSNGLAITLAKVGNDVVGSTSAGEVFRISVAADGNVTLTQTAEVDHVGTGNDLQIALATGKVTLSATATTTDGDGDTATTGVSADLGGNIRFDDDVPVSLNPDDLLIENKGVIGTTDQFTSSLNFVSGADGVGSVKFNSADIYAGTATGSLAPGATTSTVFATDADGRTLSVNGQSLYLYLNADSTVLTAKTAAGVVGFTVTLDGAGGTYTFNPEAVVANGTQVSSSSVTAVGGGNTAWKVLQDIGGTTQDAFVTTKAGATVNTNSGEFGISQGQDFTASLLEGYRIDFLNGVTFTGGGGATYGITGPYNLTNAFRQIVSKTNGGDANITVAAIISNDFDTTGQNSTLFYSDADDPKVNLSPSDIKVYNGTTLVTGLTMTDNIDGSITINGIQQGWTFEINSTTQFNAVQIDNAGGTGAGDFKLGVFSYGADFVGTKIDLNYNVVGTDGDGDQIPGTVDMVMYPDASASSGTALTGTAGDDILLGTNGTDVLNGGAGNDIIAGNSGNDTLIGGLGNDTLTGGSGSDTFKWSLGDQGTAVAPASDHITDFNLVTVASGGEVQIRIQAGCGRRASSCHLTLQQIA